MEEVVPELEHQNASFIVTHSAQNASFIVTHSAGFLP